MDKDDAADELNNNPSNLQRLTSSPVSIFQAAGVLGGCRMVTMGNISASFSSDSLYEFKCMILAMAAAELNYLYQ